MKKFMGVIITSLAVVSTVSTGCGGLEETVAGGSCAKCEDEEGQKLVLPPLTCQLRMTQEEAKEDPVIKSYTQGGSIDGWCDGDECSRSATASQYIFKGVRLDDASMNLGIMHDGGCLSKLFTPSGEAIEGADSGCPEGSFCVTAAFYSACELNEQRTVASKVVVGACSENAIAITLVID